MPASRTAPSVATSSGRMSNRSNEPVRDLMLSTKAMPEVVEYPELGKVRVATRPPFEPPDPDDDSADRLMLLFDRAAAEQEGPPR